MHNLVRIFLALALVHFVGCSSSDIYDGNPLMEPLEIGLFRLQVAPTFDSPISYDVTLHPPYKLIESAYSGQGGFTWGRVSQVTVIDLSESQHQELAEQLSRTLKTFPMEDSVLGLDGTTWLLESNLYQYAKLMVWEPEYNSEERGYNELVRLMELLKSIRSDPNA